MKIKKYKIIYASIFILILFANIKICFGQWVASGLSGTFVYSISSDGNNMFAGTYQRVYRYGGGSSWSEAFSIINNINFRAVAVNGGYVYAGTDSPFALGIYFSSNSGTNWIHANTPAFNVHSIAEHNSMVFAGTDLYGVYRSTNSGTNWTQTSLNISDVLAIVIDSNIIYAGTANFGVYISSNNGINWVQSSLNNQTVKSLAVNENIIFAGTNNNGIYLSTNSGLNWTQTSLNFLTVQSLAINGINIFAGTSLNGVLVSGNNGTSWTARNEGLSATNILTLSIYNNFLYAGTGGAGVYRRPLSDFLGIDPVSNEIPEKFSLEQNYPNPFNPSTKISFDLPKSGISKFVVYDVTGREAAVLINNEELRAGIYEVTFDGANLSSGVYFYRITSGSFTDTKKMLLVK